MQTVSLVFGILSALGMLIAFFPCLGALNWLNIPFAVIGLIISIFAYNQDAPNKNNSIAGMICCGIAIVVGLMRLLLGGGVL